MNGSHDSPLERFLRDPGHELARTAAAIAHTLVHLLPVIGAVSAIVVALVIARVVLARLRERRLACDARLLQLAVPPDVDADGALLLWSALHDLLRPRIARLLTGQPQLAWEIAADHGGSHFRIWIPGSVPPGLVERALNAAWPGITTTTAEVVE
jgi:hypothetical protein